MKRKAKILFLCTGNSCRSQMAEGWARALKSKEVKAWSAGTRPRVLDPRAVRVMAEAGVDISGQRAKGIDEVKGMEFDYVVTLCGDARETCPVFPGKVKVVHHGFTDPPRLAAGAGTEEEALGHYRRVRDEIRAFVEKLPGILREEGPAVVLNV
jgi:arsenate reductase